MSYYEPHLDGDEDGLGACRGIMAGMVITGFMMGAFFAIKHLLEVYHVI